MYAIYPYLYCFTQGQTRTHKLQSLTVIADNPNHIHLSTYQTKTHTHTHTHINTQTHTHKDEHTHTHPDLLTHNINHTMLMTTTEY